MTSADLGKYLRKKGIIVPKNWENSLRTPYGYSVETYGIPESRIIDSILIAANYWRPYITEDSFSPLVLKMVSSMCSLHACAIGSSPKVNYYIGNIPNVVLKPNLPEKTVTTVTRFGKIILFEGMAAKAQYLT